MKQPAIHKNIDNHQFPRQKVLCEKKPFSDELLQDLLEMVYTASTSFTGYLKISGVDGSLLFLFFFKGAPYAAGRYADSKPVCFSIQELGGQLARSPKESMTFSLCETDPVLLKCMLLFLQEDPAVKAPPTLLDLDSIVRQIGDAGVNAMIALCSDKNVNFFFFKDGKGVIAYYSDQAFERPEGMSIDEEMLLYAFQPGDKVQAFIFRDMNIKMSEESRTLDKASLYKLLTLGYLKNRRRENAEILPIPAIEGVEALVKALRKKPLLPSLVLTAESGPLKGERFTVKLPCIIGRSDCDLILDDRLISRRHAELKIVENNLVIEDLASKNGTKVNGKTVTKKQLVASDIISIGPNSLRIS